MWRFWDLIAFRCFAYLLLISAAYVISVTEARSIPTIASSNSPKVERSKRQALWERGFGDAGYGYSNPWNIGATISNGIGLPFLGPLTGGIFNGMIGRQIGFGTNVWDGTAGGGNMWNVGGLVGGGNRVLVNYPGLSAFSGQQYSQYRYPYFGYYSPYGYNGYYGYRYPYHASATYKNACSDCVIQPPLKSGDAILVNAPASASHKNAVAATAAAENSHPSKLSN